MGSPLVLNAAIDAGGAGLFHSPDLIWATNIISPIKMKQHPIKNILATLNPAFDLVQRIKASISQAPTPAGTACVLLADRKADHHENLFVCRIGTLDTELLGDRKIFVISDTILCAAEKRHRKWCCPNLIGRRLCRRPAAAQSNLLRLVSATQPRSKFQIRTLPRKFQA